MNPKIIHAPKRIDAWLGAVHIVAEYDDQAGETEWYVFSSQPENNGWGAPITLGRGFSSSLEQGYMNAVKYCIEWATAQAIAWTRSIEHQE